MVAASALTATTPAQAQVDPSDHNAWSELREAAAEAAPERHRRPERPDQAVPAIVNGDPIDISQRPWQVNILTLQGRTCGGSIINTVTVVTAAHCVDESGDLDVLVVAGSTTADLEAAQTSWSAAVTVHPDWNLGTITNDLAIIELTRPLVFGTNVAPITIASEAETAAAIGTNAHISGWGRTGPDQGGSPTLLNGVVEILDDAACAQLAVNWAMSDLWKPGTEVCASAADDKLHGTCGLDSGGPLAAETASGWRLIGVTSYGPIECPSQFDVFTELAAYTSWLSATIPAPPADPLVPTEFSGRLWVDYDDDGIRTVDETMEPPLDLIEINVWALEAQEAVWQSAVPLTSQGGYSVQVPPGLYDLSVSLPFGWRMGPFQSGDDPAVDSDFVAIRFQRFNLDNEQVFFDGLSNRSPGRAAASAVNIDAALVPITEILGLIYDDANQNGVHPDRGANSSAHRHHRRRRRIRRGTPLSRFAGARRCGRRRR